MRDPHPSTASLPRLAIIEDHPIVRAGTRQLIQLELGWPNVSEYGSAEAFMRAWQPGVIDALVLDLTLPDRDGLVLLQQIREREPTLPVVVFTMHESQLYRNLAQDAGATAFVSKRDDPALLVQTLQQIFAGATPAAAASPTSAAKDPLAGLTEREGEVFLLLARGHSVARVAKMLDISPKTTYTHRSNLMNKLGVANDIELAGVARGLGLL